MSKITHTNVGTGLETLGEFMNEDMHEITPGADGILLVSNPPSGKYKVVNVYVEHLGGSAYKFCYEWSNEPEP